MKWFILCKCLEDVKKRYHELIKKHHPDIGGDTATMAEINNQYEIAFERLKNVRRAATGETYNKESNETAAEYRDIIEGLLHIPGIMIEIIGTWIWITGETKPVKEELKKVGFAFSAKKAAWYWHSEEYSKRRGKNYTMDDLRQKWGSMEVEKQELKQVAG